VQQAIDRLPADQRAVIVMRYFLDVSETEMAGELQRPKSTIKYWLRTARKQLGRLLNPWHFAQAHTPEKPEKEVWHGS
jgi:RNA polymerase sigma-70 factor, ECF subfamily